MSGATQGGPRMIEFHTRFLAPLLVDRDRAAEGSALLLAERLPGKEGAPGPAVWEEAELPGLYRDELYAHAAASLFGGGESGARYLRANPALVSRWFRNAEILWPEQTSGRLRIVHAPRIELWLSDHGFGVLSILMSPSPVEGGGGLDAATVMGFNYLVGDVGRAAGIRFRLDAASGAVTGEPSANALARPATLAAMGRPECEFDLAGLIQGSARVTAQDLTDAAGLARAIAERDDPLCVHLRDRLKSPQRTSDPTAVPAARLVEVLDRVVLARLPASLLAAVDAPGAAPELRGRAAAHLRGERRARFNRSVLEAAFPGLIRAYVPSCLLGRLDALHPRPAQDRFSVYTVVRLDSSADFADPATRNALAPLLMGLAHVEEPSHAGSAGIDVSSAVLNRSHWSATGHLGAAHLVADQPGDHPYNASRCGRVVDKYFVAYLAAQTQRLVAQRVLDEAQDLCGAQPEQSAAFVETARSHVLRFALEAAHPHVSSRESVHRYARICREGLDVDRAFEAVRSALADFEARIAGARAIRAAQATSAGVAASRALHEAMNENLEAMASVNRKLEWLEVFIASVYAAELVHFVCEPENHSAPIFGAVGGAALALAVLRPWGSHRATRAGGGGDVGGGDANRPSGDSGPRA